MKAICASMSDDGVFPKMEHYCCMIDLLARSGYFKMADDLLHTMDVLPDLHALMSVLTCSSMHGNIDFGKRCFEGIVRLNPNDASGYVHISKMLSNNIMQDLTLFGE